MGLYDDVLAQERNRVATEATALPAGSGSVYLAAKGGERMRQGARKMFGIEEPAVIAAKAQEAQQVQLQGIMSKYQTASTREEFTKAMNELMANGFDEQAAKVQEHLKNMPKPKEFSIIEGYNLAKEQGYDKDFMTYQLELKAAGKDNNVTFGSIPPGYEVITNKNGNIEMRVVPGGPADIKQKELSATKIKEKIRSQNKANLVLKNIDLIKGKINNPETFMGLDIPVTGFGAWLKDVPGSPAMSVSKMLGMIKANIGFAELNDMRKASPTGGALGQVSEREIEFLQAVIGSLEQQQSKEDVLRVLGDVEYWYSYFVHGPSFDQEIELDDNPAEVTL